MKKVDRKKIDMKVYGDRKESGGRRKTDKKLWGRRKQWFSRGRRNKPAAHAAGQTLSNATLPVGKIHKFSKIAVTFEPTKRLICLS